MSNIGIYKITSPSGKVYIGQSWNLKRRFERYRGLESKKQPKLHNSFMKYGVKAHEFKIIAELPIDVHQEILDIYEDAYLCQYKNCGIEVLNIRDAGGRGKHSEETKHKIGVKNKGRYVGIKRGIRTEEHKFNMSISQKGKKKSPKQVEKNRLGHIGLKLSQKTKEKMSLSRSGINNPRIKSVIDTETGATYISCREASNITGIRYKSLSRYLNGTRNNPTTLKYYNNGR